MTPTAAESPAPRRWPVIGYIALVAVAAVGLTTGLAQSHGLQLGGELAAFAALALGQALVGEARIGDDRLGRRTVLSLSGIIVLGGLVILGPAGAGILGAFVGLLVGRSIPLRARVFNAGQYALLGLLSGLAFVYTGGSAVPEQLDDPTGILFHLAIPLLVADVVQCLLNALLLAVVINLSGGDRVLVQARALVTSTGAAYVGYGFIAFLLVLLWRPAGLGPAASLLVLAPLLVAQWAYRQHAEELEGQRRVLRVLVAAVEAKVPHLAGHSERVSRLAGDLAQELDLGPRSVADVRTAGMLHDLGQTSLPTATVRSGTVGTGGVLERYPEHSATLLHDLPFLAGALPAIRLHRSAVTEDARVAPEALVLGAADEYDLLTTVGTPDGTTLDRDQALERLAASKLPADVVDGLRAVLARRVEA